MNNHTPGPWKSAVIGRLVIAMNTTDVVAKLTTGKKGKKEREANARLIAAAPEMLEYIQKRAASFENLFTQRKPSESEEKQYAELIYLISLATKQ